jgi:hypothetical protein
MKTSSIIAAGLMILLTTAFTANARQTGEPPVKILPTAQKGILKVLYAAKTENGVEVKFFDDSGVLALDRIKGNRTPNGFTKKYDVSNVKSETLWVEINSDRMNITYKLIPSQDGLSYEPLLEKTTYNHLSVTAKN